MNDPKIKTAKVVIKYKADDGYHADMTCSGLPDKPQIALLEGLKELARLTALFGFEAEALEVFNTARANVAEWRDNRLADQAA